MTTEMKNCYVCGEDKPITQFNASNNSARGRACKACDSIQRSIHQVFDQRIAKRLGISAARDHRQKKPCLGHLSNERKRAERSKEKQIMTNKGLLNADGTWLDVTAEVRTCRIDGCAEECVKHPTGHYIHARCREHVNETSTIGNDERKEIREALGIDSKTWDAASKEQKAQWRADHRESRGDVKPEKPKDPLQDQLEKEEKLVEDNWKETLKTLDKKAQPFVRAELVGVKGPKVEGGHSRHTGLTGVGGQQPPKPGWSRQRMNSGPRYVYILRPRPITHPETWKSGSQKTPPDDRLIGDYRRWLDTADDHALDLDYELVYYVEERGIEHERFAQAVLRKNGTETYRPEEVKFYPPHVMVGRDIFQEVLESIGATLVYDCRQPDVVHY